MFLEFKIKSRNLTPKEINRNPFINFIILCRRRIYKGSKIFTGEQLIDFDFIWKVLLSKRNFATLQDLITERYSRVC